MQGARCGVFPGRGFQGRRSMAEQVREAPPGCQGMEEQRPSSGIPSHVPLLPCCVRPFFHYTRPLSFQSEHPGPGEVRSRSKLLLH